MAVEKSYAKLGFFIVVALIVVLGTAALFVQRLRSREVIAMVTYTTDNVFGLDVSSAVRYKGVPVGRVTDLRVDPRGNLIEIDFEVFLHRLNTIGMNVKAIRRITDLAGCSLAFAPGSWATHSPGRRTCCSIRRRILHNRLNLDSNRIGPTCLQCRRLLQP